MDQQDPKSSHHLLEVTNTDSSEFGDTAKEFFEQNAVISQEIQKYDDLLSTCPMTLYKIWLILYFLLMAQAPLALVVSVQDMFRFCPILSSVYPVLKYFWIIENLVSAWGCVLVWKAISLKSIEKIEKGIFLLKVGFWSSWVSVFVTMLDLFVNSSVEAFNYFIGSFLGPLLALLAYVPTVHIRDVLVKRKPFYEASSYGKDEGY